ncbi:hypothetical protein L9F63_006653, partial [Diploptera punctata]
MLKWTVGHRKAAGVKRSPSGVAGGGGGGSGPCYSIRRAAAKLHLSRRRSRESSGSGGNLNRSKSCDKENQGGNDSPACLSPRTRDSVYMRLDSIPAALRDVSNHYQAQTSPAGSPAHTAGLKRIRKQTSLGQSTDVLHPINTLSLTSRLSTTSIQNDKAKRFQTISPSQKQERSTSDSQKNNMCNKPQQDASLSVRNCDTKRPQLASNAAIQSPLQIEYSPCPVRTTKSLLALRRRLTDTFVQPFNSVGALQSLNYKSHDNPLYFTLKTQSTSKSSKTSNFEITKSPSGNSSDEIPIKFRRKDPKLCSSKKTRHSISNCAISGSCKQEANKLKLSKESLSPLSRNLASLRLSSGSKDDSVQQKFPGITPPSPFLSSTTFIKSLLSVSQNQRSSLHNQLGVVHDVTDPRFLSLYSMLEPSDNHAESPSMETKCIVPDQKADESHTPVSVNRILCFPEESPVKNADTPKTNVEYNLKKRHSLRRTRTLTSNSEDGPPVKIQPIVSANGSLIMPHSHNAEGDNNYHNCSSEKSVKRCSELRTRKSSRRRSKNMSSENTDLKGLGDGVFTNENLICDSVFSNEKPSSFVVDEDSFDGEESMLKRRGGIRRKQRTIIRNSGISDSCLFKIPNRTNKRSGLTLPNGIPSPFSPQDSGWAQSSGTCGINSGLNCGLACHNVGLPKVYPALVSSHHVNYKPSSTIISRLNGTVSCSDIQERPPHFGLTLPEGIPSPPSPSNDDDDQYSSSVGIAGIQPLSSSPVLPAEDSALVMWRQKRSSSSSDDTWNSHNMHFMKTPRLTSAHVLNAALTQETDSQPKSDEADSSNATSIEPSPLALVERRSRSRRCLSFASPSGSVRPRRTSSVRVNSSKILKDFNHSRGELELAIYANSGLLTIHVISGRNLRRSGGKSCNAYVKVTLVPSSEERTFHRTSVHRESSCPWFDQKFSFEILPTDLEKRVFVSAWHRDKEK